MNNVSNKKVLRLLADRERRADRGRSLVMVVAIALTATLLSALFTISGSLLAKTQEDTMRQVGGSCHVGYKYLTREEYDRLQKAGKGRIRDISYRITVGDLANPELGSMSTEVAYYEDLDARLCFCSPTVGKLPEKEDEIAVSDLLLNKLGLPAETGQIVHLVINTGNHSLLGDFKVCGIYTGDTVSMAQNVIVSKAYQEKYVPLKTESVLKYGSPANPDDYNGRIMADINFPVGLFLKQQADRLTKAAGFPSETDVGINWAYMTADIDVGSVLLMALILALVVFSGYLIIYNIFYINVYADIRHYGLLKTIGTSGRQVRRIVKRQADVLSIIGIPVGLIMGALLARVLLPLIMADLIFSSPADEEIVLNPWIFVGASLFSYVTVRLSCIRPARMAARVTPVEAVRMAEGQYNQYGQTVKGRKRLSLKEKIPGIHVLIRRNRKNTMTKSKKKRAGKVTPRTLAAGNLTRDRKKMVIVVASLSLALILFNGVYTFVNSFDKNAYVRAFAISDFSVTDVSVEKMMSAETVLDGVTKEFLTALSQQEGIQDCENIYFSEEYDYTDDTWKKIDERVLASSRAEEEIRQMLDRDPETSYEEYMDTLRREKELPERFFGIGKITFEHLDFVKGDLDWEKFQSGNYVIAGYYDINHGLDMEYFYPGETITLKNREGKIREYQVMGVAEVSFAAGPRYSDMWNNTLILPEGEYLDFLGDRQPLRTIFNVTEENREKVGEWLQEYCQHENPNLTCISRESLIHEFMGTIKRYAIVGNALALIIMLIGILNFVNTMATSIISRKRELAMMEAVGMTVKQQVSMLIWEGSCYAFLTCICSLVFSTLLSSTILKQIISETWMFNWHFTLLPVCICIPILFIIVFIIAALVPIICYKYTNRDSLVNRMR